MRKHYPLILVGSAGLAAFTAIIVMLGWIFHLNIIVNTFPESYPMQFNTALSVFLLSVTAILNQGIYRNLARLITALVFIFAALTLSEYILNINYGVDTLFITPFMTSKLAFIGRMSPSATVALIFISAALFILAVNTCSTRNCCTAMIAILTALTFAIATLPLLDYAVKIKTLTAWGNFTQMSIETGFCLVLLCVNVFVQTWNRSENHLIWAPAILSFTGLLISSALCLALRNESNSNMQAYLSEEAGHFTSVANSELKEINGALERMRERWQAAQGTSNKLWKIDVDNYQGDIDFISWVAWVNPKGGIERLSPNKNQTEIQAALQKNPQIYSYFLQAKTTKTSQTLSDFTIGNQHYFLYIAPLNHSKGFDGYLIAFMNTSDFVKTVSGALHPPLAPLFTQFYDGDTELFSNLDPSYNKKISHFSAWQKKSIIINNNRKWLYLMTPSQQMLDLQSYTSSWLALFGGLLMSLLAALSLFSSLKWKSNAQDLKASQHLNNAIMNSSSYLIIAIDPHGKVILFNPQAEKSLGYTADEVINKTTPAIWHDKNEMIQRAKELSEEFGRTIQPGFDVFVAKALKEGQDTHEWTFIRKDGSRFPALLAASPLYFQEGELAGFVGIIDDLTDQKAAEEKIKQKTADLERSNQALEAFAYAASHDLKAPLRVIDNASKWLQEDLKDHITGENLENMNLLRSRVKRMERLLDDLLAYSKVGRQMDETYAEKVSGKELMQDITELLAPPPEFTISVSPNFEKITVNRMPLKQIILNLINNAIKHHESKAGTITVSAEDQSDHYIISVADDGPGIPAEFREEVFKMLRTLKPRDQVEGSGMGLAMVKKYIDVFGGKIWIEDNQPHGAIFKFIWPKQQQLKESML